MNEYIGIAVSFVLAATISGAMVWLGSTLGKKNPTPEKMAPFECGKEPFSLPMGKLASLEDIAAAALYLASPAAAMVTGTHLIVDGGWTAQ